MLETSTSTFSTTVLPELICGVTARMVPTCWRCTVLKAVALPVLVEYWPVMKGTSCANLDARLLVVEHRDGRPRDDVGARVALDRADDRGKIDAGGLEPADGHGGAR